MRPTRSQRTGDHPVPHRALADSLFAIAVVAALVCLAPARAAAPVLTALHSFSAVSSTGTNLDGAIAYAGLIQAKDGNFYGTTVGGGAFSTGVFFRITPGGEQKALYSFAAVDPRTNTNSDGSYPLGVVQGADGSFYGTASSGGAHGLGTVFKITRDGVLTTLHSFSGTGSDGSQPFSELILGSDGNFYGTTLRGGGLNSGTVYKITPGGMHTTLTSLSTEIDGGWPHAPLVQGSDGDLYGAASRGGALGVGTLFKVTTAGKLTVLHSFGRSKDANGRNLDGEAPIASLVQGRDGSFYGGTYSGGANDTGTLFKITPAGVFTLLHTFSALQGGNFGTNADGSRVVSLRLGRDGGLYGVTENGGTGTDGVVFKYTPGGALTTLHSFSRLDEKGFNADGSGPNDVVQGSDGDLYGTTKLGGKDGKGVVFKIKL